MSEVDMSLVTARHEAGFALVHARVLAQLLQTWDSNLDGALRAIDEARDALDQVETALLLGVTA